MLLIRVHESERFDESTNRFVFENEKTIEFEHSLFSVSKWESEFQKPFISETDKTTEETLAYFKHMLVSEDVGDDLLKLLTRDDITSISEYITSPMSATKITDKISQKGPRQGEFITSELLYYYMVALNIPMECERWHLNRLITLIRVTNLKNQPPKKMSPKDARMSQAQINAQRRAALGTTG